MQKYNTHTNFSEITSLEEQLASLTEAIEAREATIAEQTARINKIEDKLFKDFSTQVGVTNIREYEERRESWEKEKAKNRLLFSNQISLLENQYQFKPQLNKTNQLITPFSFQLGSSTNRIEMLRPLSTS